MKVTAHVPMLEDLCCHNLMIRRHLIIRKQKITIKSWITVKSPNAVSGLYVVIGNTEISFGPAQFICKDRRFFQK